MFKTALLAAAAVAALAGSAQASTLDLVLSSAGGSVTYGGSGTALNPNVDINHLGAWQLSTSKTITASGDLSIPGYANPPSGTLHDNYYLAVTGGGYANFSLNGNGRSFGFTWGSPDSYNSLVLTDSRGKSYTITGTDIMNYLSNSSQPQGQANVVFSDPFGYIVSASLRSSGNSFEVANFSGSAVPLPASAVLFAMGLAGLALVSRKKSSDAA